jgi:hypothetical protein
MSNLCLDNFFLFTLSWLNLLNGFVKVFLNFWLATCWDGVLRTWIGLKPKSSHVKLSTYTIVKLDLSLVKFWLKELIYSLTNEGFSFAWIWVNELTMCFVIRYEIGHVNVIKLNYILEHAMIKVQELVSVCRWAIKNRLASVI